MEKIKILGAGLSGLTAAINLSHASYEVDIFEKSNDCGKRFFGDLEGLENWTSNTDIIDEFKTMNVKINFNINPFKTINISDGNEILKKNFKKPVFYIVKRGITEKSLDQGMKKQALDLGVNINFNKKSSKNDVDIISTGTSENKYVGIVKGIRFETDSDDIAVALLNNEAANSGYSYLLISEGYGTICSVNLYTTGEKANEYYKRAHEIITNLFDFKIKNKENVGGVGTFLLKPRLIKTKKLYIGEAAGLQDFLWGFGMRYAINSGYYAAKSIIEKKNYKKLINKNLIGKLNTSIVNRYLLEKYPEYSIKYMINKAKKNDNWLDLLHKRYNPSWYSRIILPIAKRNLKSNHKDIF